MIGQKAYSLKDKHAGRVPSDVRPAKDPDRPTIRATRAEAKKKSGGGSRKKTAVTKGVNDKK